MIGIKSDTFSNEAKSSKDLAFELDKELVKDCLTKRKRKRVYLGYKFHVSLNPLFHYLKMFY